MLDKARKYLEERKKWTEAGRPLRKPEEIKSLYHDHCEPCEHREKNTCGICGCYVKPEGVFFNKLAWGSTVCPDDPPRWGESTDTRLPSEEETKALIEEEKEEDTSTDLIDASAPPEPPVKKCCSRG